MPGPDHTATPGGTASGQAVPRRSGPLRSGPRWGAALGALAIGAGIGLLGTVLHVNFSWMGGTSPADGAWVLPWGAVLALLLVAATQCWWTLTSTAAWTGGIVAIGAFTTALLLSAWPGADSFVVPATEYTLAVVPGPAIAGLLWTWGIPVVAILTMLGVQPLLRHPRPRD